MIKKTTTIPVLLVFLAFSGCSSTRGPSQAWIPAWKQTSSLTSPRAGVAAVAVNDVIYAIGGVDNGHFLNTTEYAKVQKDGALGPWQAGPVLNEERGFTEAVVHNGFVYVVGGGNGPAGHHLLRSVERSRILPDGTLGPWQKDSAMQVTRRCTKLIATDKKIYSFGGFGGVLLDSVESAEFRPDGSLGEWKVEPEVMTMQRYVNGVKKMHGAAYIIGGHDATGGGGITAVEWSRFDKAGVLQKWKATSPLKTGRYALGTAVYGDYLYAAGGQTGADYLGSIEKTKVRADGELDAWESTTPLPQPRAAFGMIVYKDKVYVIGGSNRGGTLYTVGYATLNDTGEIGFWGSAQQADTYNALAEAAKARSAEHVVETEGVVKEVMQTGTYTYLQVRKSDGSTEWVAGPKLEVAVDSRVRYSSGTAMSNFHSKELNRTFPSVQFVGQVQKVE